MPHSHSHSHADAGARSSPRLRRRLALALAPFVVATAAGLVALWPSDIAANAGDQPPPAERVEATVAEVEPHECEGVPQGQAFSCATVTAEIDAGPDAGQRVTFEYAAGKGASAFDEGDRVVVAKASDQAAPAGGPEYYFVDFQRSTPLIVLAAAFALMVVVTSRWRGLSALLGLGLSVLVLVNFILPAILQGKDPLLVAIVGSAAIMFVALYLAHGFNVRTTTAVLGTLASLALTAVLASVFVDAAHFTGVASEEATFLEVSAEQINLRGLILGGIVIGALGVLDDVTVTQASAVWELHTANPSYDFARLYRSGINIGRDHIASTVNTLVLAYVGASLPLMVLFTLSQRPLNDVLTSEIIAEEIVRTLVGSIGLVASVPLTTGLAALVVRSGPGARSASPEGPEHRPEAPAAPADDWRRPRAEREWREGAGPAAER